MGWHDTNYDPRVDGYGSSYGEEPDHVGAAQEDWDRERRRKYPRGYGPPYSGENGPELDDPEGYSRDQNDPDRYLADPGFSEREVDMHPDPDHGREDKVGGILTQREQWPDRVAGIRQSAHSGYYESELAAMNKKDPVGGDVKRVKGLYGEDEDHPYDVYAKPSPDGKGWDVIHPVGE